MFVSLTFKAMAENDLVWIFVNWGMEYYVMVKKEAWSNSADESGRYLE